MPSPRIPNEENEEDAPLLSPLDADYDELPFAPKPKKKGREWVVLVTLIVLCIAVLDVGGFLAEPPKTRVYEANLCIRHYQKVDPSKILADGTVPESLCKVDPVQQKLAMILGWADTFEALPGLLLAIPMGSLADRIGRKWVFVGALAGAQMGILWVLFICWMRSLPLQLTWFSAFFHMFGGGPLVASAVGMAMVADEVPPEKRTTVFLYISASILVAEIIAPIIAARLMEHGDWLPLLLAVAVIQAGIFLGCFFPETLHVRDLPEPRDDVSESIELQSKEDGFGLQAQLKNFKAALLFLRSDITIALVIFTFMGNRLGRQSLTLLIRYASKRYNWEIKKAAYLLSFRAATNLVAITVFLPIVNYVLVKYMRVPIHWADLWISRGSLVIMTLSFFILAVAVQPAILILGLLVYNLGTGFGAAMRSVAIHVAGGQASPDIGKLMSLIAIAEAISVMMTGPIINGLFQVGMDLGPAWLGLPFAGSSVVFGFITIVTFLITVKEHDVEYMGVATEEDEPRASSSAIESGTASRTTT